MTEPKDTARATMNGLRPVFVVGHPRSGTSITQQIMSAHADLWSGRETLLFSHILKTTEGWETRLIPADNLNAIFSKLEGTPAISLPEESRAEIRALAQQNALWPAQLLDAIMRGMRRPGLAATRWLEKSPFHLRYLPQIWTMFPDARVIHVVRDPRDVVSSHAQLKRIRRKVKGLLIAQRFANTWNQAIETVEAVSSDPRLMTIRYDDIVTEPEQTVTRMSEHVGIALDLTVLKRFSEEFEQVTVDVNSVLKEANRESTIIDRRGIWKGRISTQQARVVETLCGEVMGRYGYKPEYPPIQHFEYQARLWKLRQDAARTGRRLMRAIRRRLP